MLPWLRANWFVVFAIAIGGLAVLAIGLTSQNTTAIMWAGGIVGVLVGGAIAFNSQAKEAESRNARPPRKKKR
jgi:succinate-acetate transporter protein